MSHSSKTSTTLRNLSWRSATLQLFFFAVLPLTTLLVLITLGSLTLHGRAMRELVGDRDERAVRAASEAIAEQLSHRAAAIRGLALHAAGTDSYQAVLADYAFLLPDFEGGLALFAPDGTLLAALPSPDHWPAWPVSGFLAPSGVEPEARFSPVFHSANSPPMMTVAAAAPNGLAAVGAFAPETLARRAVADALASNGQTSIWLLDNRGQLLYQTGAPPHASDIAQHPGVAGALNGQSGTRYVVVQGSEHVVAFSPIPTVGWALVVEEPWEAVDTPLLRRTQAAPLILIPVVLLALVVVGFGLRQIVQPLRLLEQRAAELGWGRFEAIEQPVGGIAEIRNLQAELVRMAQKVRAAQQSLHGYVSAITLGQEDERRRLARGLHDGAVQALIALDQRLQMAQRHAQAAAPEMAARLAEIRQMAASLIEDVRRVIRALRPIYLEDLGLMPAVETLVRDLESTTGVSAAFIAAGQIKRLPPEREIAVYRIAQEVLSNIARHAGAKTAQVSATFEAPHFVLRVQDDGRGFVVPERVADLAASGHYGLMGMQERAELIGARLSIQSAPGAGTVVELRLPL